MEVINLHGINVTHDLDLNGGGILFSDYYVKFFKKFSVTKQKNIFEWCAGPGYIGFSLYAKGICDELYLADINHKAIVSCQQTIENNNLKNVYVYHSDNLNNVPDIKWDFIVGNPPHFNSSAFDNDFWKLRVYDKEWKVHEQFFDKINNYIHKNTVILLIESMTIDEEGGSTPKTFKHILEKNKLKVLFNLPQKKIAEHNFLGVKIKQYFLGIASYDYQEEEWVKKVKEYSKN